jgi:hypothetical protein
MTAKQLPPRPNLDQLKRQAKDLLQSARRHEPGARARFRALPALATAPEETLERATLALHDAQSVIAREHGFDSWKALRERVEELTLDSRQRSPSSSKQRRTDAATVPNGSSRCTRGSRARPSTPGSSWAMPMA